jgi:hypothetical protein
MWANSYGEGIYTYTVYENETNSNIALSGATNEGTSYSKARYTIEIWVEEDDDTGALWVRYVNAKTIINYFDEEYEDTPGGEKLNPSPGGVNEEEEITIEDDFSQVIFTNKYWVSDGGGDENPDQTALEIIKKVTGNDAELSKLFFFNVKVTQPGVITNGTQTYKAYVLNESGDNVTSSDNYGTLGTDDNGYFILFTSGAELKGVRLSDGQRLAFVDLHVGAAVEAVELEAKGYTPRYERTFSTLGVFKATTDNTTWGFPSADDPGPHIIPIGTGNTATFTNHRTGAAPMGITMDNLPFVLVIILSIVGILAFVVLKSKKKENEDATAA